MNDRSGAIPSREGQPSLTGLYEILLELGRGGMGTVHLARSLGQAGFERLVVLKRMHPHLLSEPRSVRRFIDEARIAAQLHHANIVGIQQVGADDSGYFLVLDYVEGDSIDGLIQRAAAQGERLSPRVIARALIDGLTGLSAAHEASDGAGEPLQILHRDVSIQNLLVGRDGITRLTDFGIARDARASGATAPGRLVGKPLYMSPEYLRGEAIDVRVDVYGMGVTAWVAFAGSEPWPSASDAQLVLLTMQKGIPPLGDRQPDLPEELVHVVARATSADAAKRFDNARAMADALSNAAEMTIGLATQDEVAAAVQKLAGAELAQRRKRVATIGGSSAEVVRANRVSHDRPMEQPAVTMGQSGGHPVVVAQSLDEGVADSPGQGVAVPTPNVVGESLREVADEEPLPPVATRPMWLPFAIGAAVVLSLGAAVILRRSPDVRDEPHAATAPPSASSAAPAPPPLPSASTAPATSASADPPPSALRPPRGTPRPPSDPPSTKRPPSGISTSNPYLH